VLYQIDRDEVGLEFAMADVDAPISGLVGRLWAERGESVSPATRLATIVNLNATKVVAQAIERDLPLIRVGQQAQVRVSAVSDESIAGRVAQVSPIVDSESQTAPVEITLSGRLAELRPGMLARATLTAESRENVLIVPYRALMRRDDGDYVFVAVEDTVSLRKVETGLEGAETVEIINGLEEGDVVVTVGQMRLEQGSAIRIYAEEMSR
jgi:membrane fusion protein (multidrug efflux system)